MYGDLRQAEHQLTTALARFRELGDRWGQAESLYLLGGLAHIRGRYEQALHALDEGAELATQLGNTDQTIKLLAIAGNILVLSGDYPAARARHEEALRLAQRLSLQSDIAFIRNGMGLCARRQGDSALPAPIMSRRWPSTGGGAYSQASRWPMPGSATPPNSRATPTRPRPTT